MAKGLKSVGGNFPCEVFSALTYWKPRSLTMKRIYSKLLLMAAVLLFTGTLALAQARPQVGKYAKVYKGSEGLYLTLVRIGPAENNETLVTIEGIDHPWDGKIMIAKAKRYPRKTEYTIQVDGKDYVVFINRSGSGEVYLRKGGNPDHVYYDEDRSRQVIPEHFLTAYLKQQDK
jgi:hypothetical protein